MTHTPSPERQQALVDLFCTAIEGGVSYWSQCGEYRWSEKWPWDEKGVYLWEIEEIENPDATKYRLTPALMLTGLNRVVKLCPGRKTNCGGTFAKLARTLGTDDQEDYDAGDADVIAQFALGLYSVYDGPGEMHGRTMETYG